MMAPLLCAKHTHSPGGLEDSMENKIWVPPSRDNVGKKPKPLLEEVRRAAPPRDAASTTSPMREGGTALAGPRSEPPGLPTALQVYCCDV